MSIFLFFCLIVVALAQPDSPIGSRPVIATPTTPVNTKAALEDLPTGLELIFTNYTISKNVTAPPPECTTITASKINDCGAGSLTSKPCCYMIPVRGGSPICYPIDSSAYMASVLPFDINGTNYYANCDTRIKRMLDSCGKLLPTQVADCTSFSLWDNSCCLFKSGGENHCFWFGSVAPLKLNSTQINCESIYIKYYSILFIILIGFLIL